MFCYLHQKSNLASALLLSFLWGAGGFPSHGAQQAWPVLKVVLRAPFLVPGALNDTLSQQRAPGSDMWCNYFGKPYGLQRTVIKEQEISFYRIERWCRDQTINFLVDHIYLHIILSSLNFCSLSMRTSLMTNSNFSKCLNHSVRSIPCAMWHLLWFWLSKCHLPPQGHLAIGYSHY